MITKNEFYGQYLICSEECGEEFTVWDCLKEAGRAWEVIEKLQVTGMPPRFGEFISDDQVRSALDSNIEFTVDDDAEEPKPGRLDKIQSNDGLFIGNPEAVKSYNDNQDDNSFFTDEQKAEIKAIVIGELWVD